MQAAPTHTASAIVDFAACTTQVLPWPAHLPVRKKLGPPPAKHPRLRNLYRDIVGLGGDWDRRWEFALNAVAFPLM